MSTRRRARSEDREEPAGLIAWLEDAAATDPSREILIEGTGAAGRRLSAADLLASSRRLAGGLAALGVGSGDTVALWLPNGVEWMALEFACAGLDATVLGLNTRYKSYELTHLLRTVDVAVLVLPEEFLGIDFLGTLGETLTAWRGDDPRASLPRLVFVGDVPPGAATLDAHSVRYADLATAEPLPAWTRSPHSLANLFTTSGSTSAPKVAGHDQASILRHARAGAAALGVRHADRLLGALPLCGVFGFNSAMAALVGGGAIVLLPVFRADEAARSLVHDRITHVVGGDEMLSAIFDAVPPDAAVSHLRRGGIANFTGRAKDVVEAADRRWGAKITGVYGSSELFALTALWPEQADLELRCLQGGVVVDDGIEVRVVDMATGRDVEPGTSGELQFRGYNTITGYVNNPGATEAAITSDGWFKTGDMGYLHAGGFVYQCRAREALRLRGFLVEPGEIEEYLAHDPSVDEVHVVGVDAAGGTRAIAFARARPGHQIDEDAMLAEAARALANYKVPARIVEVAEFPTTSGTNGTKVRFDVLRDLARDLLTPS